MRKLGLTVIAVLSGLYLSGCMAVQAPAYGILYTDVKGPVSVSGNGGGAKVGKAVAQVILGLVATGDASVEAAAKAGGITKIHHVDAHSTNILGIIGTYETIVYGD